MGTAMVVRHLKVRQLISDTPTAEEAREAEESLKRVDELTWQINKSLTEHLQRSPEEQRVPESPDHK
jgi:hypothetical protein